MVIQKIIFLIILFLIFGSEVNACVCGCDALGSSSTGFGGSIITTSAYTMPQNSFSLGSGIRFNNFEDFNIKQVNSIRNNGIHAHNRDSQMFNYLAASYGLTENLTMTAVYPYGYFYGLKSYDLGQIIDEGNSIGFGDLTLQAKYKFLDFEKIKFASSIIAGIKMPTGQINERDSFGDLIPADHQPGSGSWDPIMGMAFTKIFGEKISLDSSVLYKLSTKGNQDLIIGDQISFNMGLSYSLKNCNCNIDEKHTQKFNLAAVLELNGRWQERTEYNGLKDDAHGGTVIYLSPGLRASYDNKWIADLSVGLPVIESLNGIQPENDMQLVFNLARIF